MAKYDLPATMNYILSVTGQANLFYIGHSQGTEIMFAAQSGHYVPVDQVKLFVALGPAAYLAHVKSPLRELSLLSDQTLVDIFGKKDFMPQSEIVTWLGKEVCSKTWPGLICENVLFLLGGYDFKYMNESRIPVYLGQHPAGTSVQTMIHYAQAVRTGYFQMFDFGPEENMKKYNTTMPPQFKPEEISIPVALVDGSNDWLTVCEDVQRLAKELQTVVYKKTIPGYEHLDFIWAVNAPQACYTDILGLLKAYM